MCKIHPMKKTTAKVYEDPSGGLVIVTSTGMVSHIDPIGPSDPKAGKLFADLMNIDSHVVDPAEENIAELTDSCELMAELHEDGSITIHPNQAYNSGKNYMGLA